MDEKCETLSINPPSLSLAHYISILVMVQFLGDQNSRVSQELQLTRLYFPRVNLNKKRVRAGAILVVLVVDPPALIKAVFTKCYIFLYYNTTTLNWMVKNLIFLDIYIYK